MTSNDNMGMNEILGEITKCDFRKVSKTYQNGVVAVKEGNSMTLKFNNAKLIIERAVVGNEIFFSFKCLNEYNMVVEGIDFEIEGGDPIEHLFCEWVLSGYPTDEEISSITGKEFTGKVKELRRYSRLKQLF